MPPKKKEKAPVIDVYVGEYNITQMTLPELQGFAYRMQDKVEALRKTENFYQVERDRIEQFLDISAQDIKRTKEDIVQTFKEIEDLGLEFEEKLTERKEKLWYIEYERERKAKELKENTVDMHEESQTQLQNEKITNYNRFDVKNEKLEELRLFSEEEMAVLSRTQDENLKNVILKSESTLKETIAYHEDMHEELKNNLCLLKDVEAHEYEEQKRNEYREYIEKQTQCLEGMKDYFKAVTGRSLSLIDILKSQIQNLKKAEGIMKLKRGRLEEQNGRLRHITKEARACNIKLAHFEQDKKSDEFTQRRIKTLEKQITAAELENKNLDAEFKATAHNKDNLKFTFVSRLSAVSKGLNGKVDILQRKVSEAKTKLLDSNLLDSNLTLHSDVSSML